MTVENKSLWGPSEAQYAKSGLAGFIAWLDKNHGLTFRSYQDLWEWSTRELATFWEVILQYFEVIHDGSYSEILSGGEMPDVRWFDGLSLNYAEHIFARAHPKCPALIAQLEGKEPVEMSWDELRQKVGSLSAWMKSKGIQPGDRVVAYLPNISEAIIAFLATNALGAVWSSCSPDFGERSVVERFSQIEPKLIFAVSHYQYGGKTYDRTDILGDIVSRLPTLEQAVIINNPGLETSVETSAWSRTIQSHVALEFVRVPFSNPIWILFSSGTTGQPKAITHGVGGVLLEHLKYLVLMNDVRPGERFFWYTTTGWMMWNFLQASLLAGATPVLFQGSPTYPHDLALWDMAEQVGIQHFGTSPPYLMHLAKTKTHPQEKYTLANLRSIGSTGSPLPPAMFDFVYTHIKSDVWLCSMSGGTDVCTAFIGSVPGKDVLRGEIQGPALGVALKAFDASGESVTEEVGEMVITQPMPSMPIYFWNDPDRKRYRSSYFEMYPGGIWRHGDWIKITASKGLVILGRSDATLNRKGIRIGTAEIYRPLEQLPQIQDSLIVNLEYENGQDHMPLFVKLAPDLALDDHLVTEIKRLLRSTYSPRHVPDEIIVAPDIPYTISGKKMEAPVKRILLGVPIEKAANLGAMRNPEALQFFVKLKDRFPLFP